MRTNGFRLSLPLGRVREGLPLRTNGFRLLRTGLIADLLDWCGMAFDMFQLRARSFCLPIEYIILVLGSDIIKPRKDIELVLTRRNLCHRIERTLGFRHPNTFQLALVVDKRAHSVGLYVVESDQGAVFVVDRIEDGPHIAHGIAASDLTAEEISKHIGGGHLIVVCGVLHELDGERLSEDVRLADCGVVHKCQDLLAQELPLSVPKDWIAVHRHARVLRVEDQRVADSLRVVAEDAHMGVAMHLAVDRVGVDMEGLHPHRVAMHPQRVGTRVVCSQRTPRGKAASGLLVVDDEMGRELILVALVDIHHIALPIVASGLAIIE